MTKVASTHHDCRLVMITWIDSGQADGAWQWLSDYQAVGPVEAVSVGWLIQDDDQVKVITQSLAPSPDGEDCQAAGRKMIPTCCVKRIDSLFEADASRKEAA